MQRIEHSFKAMGGPCRLRLFVEDEEHAKAAIGAAVAEIERLENKFSRYRADSLTSLINGAAGSGEPVPIDTETAGLLHYADTVWRESDGLFDLTSGVLRRAWDFNSRQLPDKNRIATLLPLVGWQNVQWDEHSVALPIAGMEIDFGGCVKEYAADSAANQLRQHGVLSGLVDLAGDMAAVGAPPAEDGWSIGIRHPRNPEAAVATILLPEGGLASSGDYERCIDIDGVRYGHILNPHNGWPVRGLLAASVLAPQCLVAGSSATVALLMPVEDGLNWLDAIGLPWLAVDSDFRCHGSIVR